MTARVAKYSADWRLYVPAAMTMGLIVILGFGPSYFYRPFTRPADSLTGLVHLHGALMTLWIVLFITQVLLVATRRVDIHRRLGRVGFVLLALIVVVSFPMTLVATQLGGHHMPGPPLVALGLVSSLLVAFVILASVGLYFGRRGDIHKRLMLLASVTAVEAGLIRLPLDFLNSIVSADVTSDVFLFFVSLDSIRNRCLHSAFLWGMIFLVAAQTLSVSVSGTAAREHTTQDVLGLFFR